MTPDPRALTLDQPALWELTDDPAPPQRRPTHTPRPRRVKEAQAEPCDPTCLVCGKAEGRGLCTPRCSVMCVHTAQADLIEVCLVTVHVTAHLVVGIHGFEPGRRLAVVTCPFCERTHWHAPRFGRHYRMAPCGQPYIVTLTRPTDTSRTGLRATQSASSGRNGQQVTSANFNASQAATASRGAAAARAALTSSR